MGVLRSGREVDGLVVMGRLFEGLISASGFISVSM